MARNVKITQDKIELIRQLLEEGHYAITVQRAVGISHTTWHTYIDYGQEILDQIEAGEREESDLTETEQLYLAFLETIKEAEAIAEMKALNAITKASLKQWQAAAWYLERKHRDRWGKDTPDQGQGSQSALDKFLDSMTKQADEALEEEDEAE